MLAWLCGRVRQLAHPVGWKGIIGQDVFYILSVLILGP